MPCILTAYSDLLINLHNIQVHLQIEYRRRCLIGRWPSRTGDWSCLYHLTIKLKGDKTYQTQCNYIAKILIFRQRNFAALSFFLPHGLLADWLEVVVSLSLPSQDQHISKLIVKNLTGQLSTLFCAREEQEQVYNAACSSYPSPAACTPLFVLDRQSSGSHSTKEQAK